METQQSPYYTRNWIIALQLLCDEHDMTPEDAKTLIDEDLARPVEDRIFTQCERMGASGFGIADRLAERARRRKPKSSEDESESEEDVEDDEIPPAPVFAEKHGIQHIPHDFFAGSPERVIAGQAGVPLQRGNVIVHGHTSLETAYIVHGYPCGGTNRTIRAYWVETADKGQKKGKQRACAATPHKSWTVNVYMPAYKSSLEDAQQTYAKHPPRITSPDEWNAPKASNYWDLVFLYRDVSTGYIETMTVDRFQSPRHIMDVYNNYYQQFNRDLHDRFAQILTYSKKFSSKSWSEFEKENEDKKLVAQITKN